MRPTVELQIRSRGVEPDDFARYINYEEIPFLRQVRQGMNYINRAQRTLATDGSGGIFTIWESADIPVGQSVTIMAYVSAVSVGDRAGHEIVGVFYNTGVVAQQGATATIFSIDSGGFTVAFAVSSNHVNLTVNDPGGNAIDWVAVVDTLEVGP